MIYNFDLGADGQLRTGFKGYNLSSEVEYVYGESEERITNLGERYSIALDKVIAHDDEVVFSYTTDKEHRERALLISYLAPELNDQYRLDDLTISVVFLISKNRLTVITKRRVASIIRVLTGLHLTHTDNFAIETALEVMKNSFAIMIDELRGLKIKIDELEKKITNTRLVVPVFSNLLSLQKYMLSLTSTYKTDKKQVDSLRTYFKNGDGEDEEINNTISGIYDRIETMDSIALTYSKYLNKIDSLINNISSYQLNNIMKTLTEISIVLTIPTIIYGLWGVNVPLPFEKNVFGMLLVVLISIILSIIVWAWLRRKRYR